ncbi:hypothetical protein RAS1_03670 [Phycisphaerae bacterium RAS1]|nr:hypothetical protein RAS1_03670 [Phycisphaerae bacterium RAS1]
MTRYGSPLRALVVVAVLLSAALPCAAADPAELLPADTYAYVGWTRLLSAESAEFRILEQLAAGAESRAGSDNRAARMAAIGKFGLLLARFPGALGLFGSPAELLGDTPPAWALVIDAGGEAQKLAELATHFAGQAAAPGEMGSATIAGLTFATVEDKDDGVRFVWGAAEGKFIVAMRDAAVERVIDRARGTVGPLSGGAALSQVRKRVGAAAPEFELFIDLSITIDVLRKTIQEDAGDMRAVIDAAIRELGANEMRSIYFASGSAGGRPSATTFIECSARGGLASLWRQKPIADADFRMVPSDAYWMQVSNLDLQAAWKETQRILEEIAPDVLAGIEGAMAGMRQVLGLSITDQILPAIGDTWTLYDAPAHGGALFTGMVLAFEARDREAVDALLTRLVDIAKPFAAQEQVELRLSRTQYGPHEIRYVLIGGGPSPFAPAWAFIGDRCIMGFFPQSVAAALRQADPKTAGPCILDRPGVRDTLASLPQNAVAVGYCDSQAIERLIYPIAVPVHTFAMSALAEYGLNCDLGMLAPLPDRLAKLSDRIAVSAFTDQGYIGVSVGDMPLLSHAISIGVTLFCGGVAMEYREAAAREGDGDHDAGGDEDDADADDETRARPAVDGRRGWPGASRTVAQTHMTVCESAPTEPQAPARGDWRKAAPFVINARALALGAPKFGAYSRTWI